MQGGQRLDTVVETAVDYNNAGVAEAFPFTATAGGTVSHGFL